MLRILSTAFVGLAITTLAAFGADNSLGTWKLNTEKSKYTPEPMPIKSLTTTREASDGGIKVTSTGEQANGTPINSSASIKYDGKTYPVMGAPWDTITVKQIDDNTFTTETKQADGKYHATGRTVISEDGQTMTTTSKGINAEGVAFTSILVFDKQ
jgi:hypothetical protein